MGCCAAPSTHSNQTSCPKCGQAGKKVDEVTLKSLLGSSALERRSETAHRFCSTPSCPVVYFGISESFTTDEVTVPVFQKQPGPGTPLCYCFGIKIEDVQKDVLTADQPSIEQRIQSLVKADRCACELRNPQGSCCLGDVKEVIRAARKTRDRELAGA